MFKLFCFTLLICFNHTFAKVDSDKTDRPKSKKLLSSQKSKANSGDTGKAFPVKKNNEKTTPEAAKAEKVYLNTANSSIGDVDGPLVQYNDDGEKILNPLLDAKTLEEIHALMKRSYVIGARGKDEDDYLNYEDLIENKVVRFKQDSKSNWLCYAPFAGIHGAKDVEGLVPCLCLPRKQEMDVPGFVAWKMHPRLDVPIIAIVFSGSRGESFQPLKGFLGPSWSTNWNGGKKNVFEKEYGIEAKLHRGYYEKAKSLRKELFKSINIALKDIPKKKIKDVKFIICGHSQGASVSTIAAMYVLEQYGCLFEDEAKFGRKFVNTQDNRFFLYIMSGSQVLGNERNGNKDTKENYYKKFGRDNIVRHASIFDVITHVCFGDQFKKYPAINLFIKVMFGDVTGFSSVGHFAMADVKSLLGKGFSASGNSKGLQNVDSMVDHLKKGYKFFLDFKLCDRKNFLLRKIYLFRSLYEYQKSLSYCNITDFVAIQHFCTKSEGKGYGYDETLPANDLTELLARGTKHAKAKKGQLSEKEIDSII